MSVGAFCGLCGGPFERYDLDPGPDPSPVPWSRKARAVRVDQSRRDVTLTEVGYAHEFHISINSNGDIGPSNNFPPFLDEDVDEDVDEAEEVSLFHDPSTYRPRAYALHDFCWELFKTRVRCSLPGESRETRLAETLFWQLDNLPRATFHCLVPENRYHGATDMRKCESELSFLLSDPNEVLSITGNSIGSEEASCSTLDLIKHDSPADVFDRLPQEIICQILGNLSSKDFSNLRAASRSVASASTPKLLPQAFWATRFALNRELGFVFAHEKPQQSDTKKPWRLLYKEYTEVLRTGEEIPGIRNRQRIYRCVTDFALAAEQLLHQGTHCLTDNAEFQSSSQVVTPHDPSRFSFSCPLLVKTDVREPQLRHGVQPIARLQINLVAPPPAVSLNLSVSFLHYDCKVYISGFRSYCLDHSGQAFGPVSIGTVIPSTEEHIEIQSTEKILAVEVTASVLGIHGLVFHLDRCGEAALVAVGATTCLDSSFGKTVLQGTKNLTGMVIDFDEIKAVAIKVVEDCYGSVAAVTTDNSSHRLWNPAPLKEHAELQPHLPGISETSGGFHLHLYMGFGGSNGQTLSSLNRITAYVFSRTGFHGFRFGYDNNQDILIGKDSILEDENGTYLPCIEPTFTIDGQGGERVTSFEVRRAQSSTYHKQIIFSIKVSTNNGRFMNFQIHDGLPRPPGDISSLSIDASHDKLPIAIVATCNPPHIPWESFHVLNGAETHHRTSPFENQRSLRKGNSIEVTKDWIQHSAYWMLGSEGSCFGAASLRGIKRVRVSSGLPGRSRSPENISGLWIEYIRGDDVILGQWIHEVGSFDLTPTESLTHVSVWSTLEAETPLRMESFGRVIGIKFITSSGQQHEFRTDSSLPCISMHWRSTPYEELRDMMWAFGSYFDEVQIKHQSILSSWARLLEIHMIFVEKALVGIEFVHELGITTRLGSNSGEVYTLSLAQGENIVILAVKEQETRILSIELHTDRGQSLRAPENCEGGDSLCQAVFELDKRSEFASRVEGERKFVFSFQTIKDIGPCIGLWFLAMQDERELRFESAGPIFLARE
ncbi:unnamed protein product [Clonostachys solani]|uniref:F-box domain-containing protein n=1 Tax=Clonostachys solani TaxID=160281 RepID=A0A9N9YZN0_9HYPO|nr:unnamed protein product [Clonostachys solani]